jgi:5-methylcytosine-specific restriction endonuclease McrA
MMKISAKNKCIIWEKSNGHCWYCGLQLTPWKNFSIDHFEPTSKGGTDDINNLVPSCSSCNSAKNNTPIDNFRKILAKKEPSFFTERQIEFLKSKGIDIETLKPENYLFFFERESLERKVK